MCKEVWLLAALFTYLFQHTDAACANALGPCVGGQCPTEAEAGAMYTCIDDMCSCIANECPDVNDAGQNYVCIQDTCCPPTTSSCNDGAVNCQMFTQECFTSMYRVCMTQHCRRTCGLCNNG